MKRPLDYKDYERMTFESVAAKYEPESEQRKLYMVMTMHSWDGCARNGWVAGQKEVVWRSHALKELWRTEFNKCYNFYPLALAVKDEPKTYRISINEKGGVEVVCFDLESIDSELEGYYSEVSALPTWVQERIAVLAVCSPDPPTPTVDGIGRRISENIYWVYK